MFESFLEAEYATQERKLFVRIRTGAAAVALAALVTGASTMPAQADEPSVSITDSYREEASSAPHPFVARAENVHHSHDYPGTISGHGFWIKNSGPATHAKITTELQVRAGGNWWTTLNTAVKTVRPGGGRGKRATASWKCTNMIARHDFRIVVDADIVGFPDGPSKAVSNVRTLHCGVT
ncbi:hypothetical protein [Streptomyces sp. URMC 123]|uniref:hypothetical protein n=1 Tax=Streptomyces sp. URMC 123 TaxID=3423403 RepID=UPI003F199593